MANEIVKYGNRLNTIPLHNLNARELNLFFSIASRLLNKGTNEIVFSFDQLKDLAQYKQRGDALFNDIKSTSDKLLRLSAFTDDGDTYTSFNLFTRYAVTRSKRTLAVKVNPDFKGLFNDLTNWTRFSLEQFASLRSTYSKTMFRLLKQWRTVGKLEISMQDFRDQLDIPDVYSTSGIDNKVLKPIKKELTPIFAGLTWRKVKKGKGGRVVGYVFTFKPEANNADDFNKESRTETAKQLSNIQNNASMSDDDKAIASEHVTRTRTPKPKRSHHKQTRRVEEQPEWLKQQQAQRAKQTPSQPKPVSDETKRAIAEGLATLKDLRKR